MELTGTGWRAWTGSGESPIMDFCENGKVIADCLTGWVIVNVWNTCTMNLGKWPIWMQSKWLTSHSNHHHPSTTQSTQCVGKFARWLTRRPVSKSGPKILYGNVSLQIADPSGRSLAGIAGSNRGHGCLSLASVVCCQVEVSATSRSFVQRSPTDCVCVWVWSWILDKEEALVLQGFSRLERKKGITRCYRRMPWEPHIYRFDLTWFKIKWLVTVKCNFWRTF